MLWCWLINGSGGYSYEEFKAIAIERARNDTSSIDALVTCGLYVAGHGLNQRVDAHCELYQVNRAADFKSFGLLQDAWGEFLPEHLRKSVLSQVPSERGSSWLRGSGCSRRASAGL